ncbi:MAG: hypothetical protein GY835_18930, partial [bacterium]|nr:hypothetical protein [bacterium]
MRKVICLLAAISLLLIGLQAGAEVVGLDDARQVADNFLRHTLAEEGAWGERATAEIADCHEIVRDGQLLGYWAPIEPRGFIVVSLLRELPAIKAWSTETDFDPMAEDGLCDLLMDTMTNSLVMLEDNYGSLQYLPKEVAPDINRDSWTWLLENGVMPGGDRGDRAVVGPLVYEPWHQSSPFNGDCPMGDGGRTIVGCVATSGSQIMKYWEYPPVGIGSHTYAWDGDDSCDGLVGGGSISAFFNDPYDWDNILTSYNGSYTTEQAAAVAELSFEVAVAFEMDFGRCGSGSYVGTFSHIYHDFFDYAEGAHYVERNDYSQDGWWDIIVDELTQQPPRPMQYRIYSHAIVCDGYRDDTGRYYHMNYGWGGGQNAWYALDNVHCPWAGCDINEEGITRGIEPRTYFGVSEPTTETVWRHGEEPAAVTWSGCDASSVKINLYKGDELMSTIVDWVANTGSVSVGTVPSTWGTGPDFRLKVIGNDNKFGWSETFGIFGAGGWADATDGLPLGDAGNSQGVAWGDYDGNGDLDIYLTTNMEGNKLFGNVAGVFSDVTVSPL